MKRLFLLIFGLSVFWVHQSAAQEDFLFEFGTVVPLEQSFGDTENVEV